MRRFIFFILFSIVLFQLKCQIDTSAVWDFDKQNELYDNLESILEEKMEETVEENDYADDVSDFLQFENGKIDINRLTPEMATSILQLTDYQYYQLQLYIAEHGRLASVYELYAIEGFDRSSVERILPWVQVTLNREMGSFKASWRYGKHRLLLRYGRVLEKQAGYREESKTHYLGGPDRLAFRYAFAGSDVVSLSFSGEKDAGEEFFKGTQKQGFDFYSFHFAVKNLKLLRYAVVGDYKLNFGQGLVVGSGLMGGRSAGVAGCRKFTTGIRAVSPLNEGDFLRGVAVELGNAEYNGTLFYSHQFYDGALVASDLEPEDCFFQGSLSVSGFHRTVSELEKKNVLRNRLYGFHFQCNKRILRIGIQGIRTEFVYPVSANEAWYRKYDFSGKDNSNLGVDYQLILKKSVLFGEVAFDQGGHGAVLQGVLSELNPKVKVSSVFRYYDPHYMALNSNGFGVNSRTHNEIGLYTAESFVLGRSAELFLYQDFYYFPWLVYGTDNPSYGFQLAAKLSATLGRYAKLAFRYDYRNKEKNMKGERLSLIQCVNRHRMHLVLTIAPYSFLNLKTEADYVLNTSFLNDYNKNGWLFFQDVDLSLNHLGLDVKLRVAYFDTDTYEERIYAYEKDLLYSFTSVSHYGTGIRGYFLLKYRYDFFEVWLRIARTFYLHKQTVGSGQEEVNAPHKTELKLQCCFGF